MKRISRHITHAAVFAVAIATTAVVSIAQPEQERRVPPSPEEVTQRLDQRIEQLEEEREHLVGLRDRIKEGEPVEQVMRDLPRPGGERGQGPRAQESLEGALSSDNVLLEQIDVGESIDPDEFLALVEERFPRWADRLKQEREKNPERFGRYMQNEAPRILERIRAANGGQFLPTHVRVLIERASSGDEEAKQQLREMVGGKLDQLYEQALSRIEQAKTRIAKFEDQIESEMSNREEAIEDHLNRIIENTQRRQGDGTERDRSERRPRSRGGAEDSSERPDRPSRTGRPAGPHPIARATGALTAALQSALHLGYARERTARIC
ncbi:MAG: hypothetical protein AAGB34_09790 [Planctomycetota bacterium]